MHQSIMEQFEDYRDGRSSEEQRAAFRAHLQECRECRVEVEAMEFQASLLRVLRPEEAVEPRPGFYRGVMERVNAQRPSFWDTFLQPVFARRLVYASLMFLVLLGSVMVSTTPEEETAVALSTHEVVLASDGGDPVISVDGDSETARGAIVVDLATYRE